MMRNIDGDNPSEPAHVSNVSEGVGTADDADSFRTGFSNEDSQYGRNLGTDGTFTIFSLSHEADGQLPRVVRCFLRAASLLRPPSVLVLVLESNFCVSC